MQPIPAPRAEAGPEGSPVAAGMEWDRLQTIRKSFHLSPSARAAVIGAAGQKQRWWWRKQSSFECSPIFPWRDTTRAHPC